jgi:hypothetical protein
MGGTMNNMKTSKLWTILIALLPSFGTFGQTVTTYHSAFGIPAVESSYLAVDIAITDPIQNPNYRTSYRLHQAPALIDTETKLGVSITGTVEQAEADLNKLRAWSIPVTPRQFKLALLDIDVYPETVEEAIATIEDAKLRTAAQIEWREASVFRRDHPLLAQIAPLLGATDEMLDAIFLNAQGKE